MKSKIEERFPVTYKQSRERFRTWLDQFKQPWPDAQLASWLIDIEEDLTIDWIRADSLDHKDTVILLTGALHGVEGFVGSAMQALFMEEFLDKINPAAVGVVLVHSVNPWGMEHKRRVNNNNVDLNRNFMIDPVNFQQEFNQHYRELYFTLNPAQSLSGISSGTLNLLVDMFKVLPRKGLTSLRGAVMLGQQSYPEGLYYCGDDYQKETRVLMNLIEDLLSTYRSMVQIDFHTGYGPRYQMSLVISPNEFKKSAQLSQVFNYPLVRKADPEQFYKMQGDMIDWVYQTKSEKYQDRNYFGTAFEFGTYGSAFLAELSSLRTMIFENQIHYHGSRSKLIQRKSRQYFLDLYNPQEYRWKEKALDDCRAAFEGIFTQYNII